MLREERLLELARGWLQEVLPRGFAGRFFLAGGAFKTALHGKPPHDLDLWPVSEAEREALLAALHAQGAVVVEENQPYQTVLRARSHVVEVAWKCEPSVLHERLERADLALAAVGVEWNAGSLRAEIHPFAATSAAAREVRLMRPIKNWKYALATIERGRRYAAELGFAWPREEETALWAIFDAQPEDMKKGLVERLMHVGRADWGCSGMHAGDQERHMAMASSALLRHRGEMGRQPRKQAHARAAFDTTILATPEARDRSVL